MPGTTIVRDASSPGAKYQEGFGRSITSATFTPPAGSLVVIRVCGEWSPWLCQVTVADNANTAYQEMALATGDGWDGGVAAIYAAYFTAAPKGPIAITANFRGLGGGMFLMVDVYTAADPGQSPITGWSFRTFQRDPTTGEIPMSVTNGGSIILGISNTPTRASVFTPNSNTGVQAAHNNTRDKCSVAVWGVQSLNPTTGLLGGVWDGPVAGNVCAFEIIPVTQVTNAPALPTFVDGMVPRAADLNSFAANLRNLYRLTSGGQRYQPYVAGGKGWIKPLCILGLTVPDVVMPGQTDGIRIPWDTVYADSDNWYSPIDPRTLICKTPGLWRLHFQIQLIPYQAALISGHILINGTSISANGVAGAETYGSSNGVGMSVTLPLTTNATVSCSAYQDSGTYKGGSGGKEGSGQQRGYNDTNSNTSYPYDAGLSLCTFTAEWLSQ